MVYPPIKLADVPVVAVISQFRRRTFANSTYSMLIKKLFQVPAPPVKNNKHYRNSKDIVLKT